MITHHLVKYGFWCWIEVKWGKILIDTIFPWEADK